MLSTCKKDHSECSVKKSTLEDWKRITWEVSRSIAKWCSKMEMFGSSSTAFSKARSISLPVISAAWTILRWECPPSLARCRLPSSPWSNNAPIAINSLIRSGPSVQTTYKKIESLSEKLQLACAKIWCRNQNYAIFYFVKYLFLSMYFQNVWYSLHHNS